jgi:uncharacterized protein YdiU (UPF0061 family)
MGFRMSKAGDLESIILPLLQLLADVGADYSAFFRQLCYFQTNQAKFEIEIGPETDGTIENLDNDLILFLEQKINMALRNSIQETKDSSSNIVEDSEISKLKLVNDSKPVTAANGEPQTNEYNPNSVPQLGPSKCLHMLLKAAEIQRMEFEEERDAYRIPPTFPMEINVEQPIIDGETVSSRPERTRSSRPTSGYLSKKSDWEDPLDDINLFGPNLPDDREIRLRWRNWAFKYRSRLLLELAAIKYSDPLEFEDYRRNQRMLKRNPKFVLRGHILKDLIADAQTSTLDAENNDRLSSQQKVGLLPLFDESARRVSKISGRTTKNVGLEQLERTMKIIIGDVWGTVTESSNGWSTEIDKKMSDLWSREAPKGKKNIPFPCSS